MTQSTMGTSNKVKLVVAIDSGTQSTRCIIFDNTTSMMVKVASSQKYEHLLESPKEGWSEHRVEEIEKALVLALKESLQRFDRETHEIVGIGVTNQRETIVAWDHSTGELLDPNTICWNDMRTVNEIQRAKEEWGSKTLDDVQNKTGLKVASYYSAFKMQWMIKNKPKVQEAAHAGTLRFGTIDSYIIYRLTNQRKHVTDVTNASRTLLFDIETLKFDKGLCDLWSIPVSSLPSTQASASLFGYMPEDFSEYQLRPALQGLPDILKGAPITGAIGDQQAATIGHALFQPGGTKMTFGSGGFLLMNCGRGKPAKIPTGCTVSPLMMVQGEKEALYCAEGSIAIAGLGISWLKKNGLVTLAEIEKIINSAPSSEGVIFMPAFTGLLSPWWNEELKGSIMGMTLKTERKHIVRAFLESLAVQVREILKAMSEAGHNANLLYLDGGVSQSDGFLQILSDFTGSTIFRPPDCEMTARGAAICASIGRHGKKAADKYSEVEQMSREWEVGVTVMGQKFEPSLRETDVSYAKHVIKNWKRYYETMAIHHSDKENSKRGDKNR